MRSRVLSWGSIHSQTNICLRKSTMIDPWKGSKSEGCMAFKIIPCYKSKAKRLKFKYSKFQDIQSPSKKQCWKNKPSDQKGCQNNQYQKGSSPSMSMMRKQIYHSHKRTLWMEEPVSNYQSERSNEGRLRRNLHP